ncbi:MAG TPA: hypothetical protein VFZ98_06100, partial [Vicinamibacterales bacterium]
AIAVCAASLLAAQTVATADPTITPPPMAIASSATSPLAAATTQSASAGRTWVWPYFAVTDGDAYDKPALRVLGPAGSTFTDPVFQSTITRVTDADTRPGTPDVSYRTPSSPQQNAWSASGSYFYVTSTDGSIVPFAFDATTGTATRIQSTTSGAGGLLLNFYIEPQFSYVNDSIIYGSVADGDLHTIDQYDFSAVGQYTQIIDLETIVSGLSGTFIGGIGSSDGPDERIMAMFGGTGQNLHHLVIVFSRANPANYSLVDTWASTMNGDPTASILNFSLHHVAIDRSGRYLMLYPTEDDQTGPRQAPQAVLWDTQTDTFTEMTADMHPYGHDAFGYGVWVNQDCCTSTPTWDAVEWQFRNLNAPTATRDVLPTVLQPEELDVDSHSTWNNATPDGAAPFISATLRYGASLDGPWRALDDEIVAIQANAPGLDPTIWRFAHHRSDVTDDSDPSNTAFWYEPRPNVSHDGQWVLFTSNWEKTLGTDPRGDAATMARQDVFLVQLATSGPTTVAATASTPGRTHGGVPR